jgi:hypothetical protein
MREALRVIGERFESMNGVPVTVARITADEFAAIRAALAAPAPMAQSRMVEVGDTSTPANRLATLIASALGEHHPAMDDLAALVLFAAPAPVARLLTDKDIEAGRHETFSTSNPFCPCTDKTMRKAVRWAERACAKAWGVKLATGQEGGAA